MEKRSRLINIWLETNIPVLNVDLQKRKKMKINNKLLWIYILSASVYFTQGIEGLPGLSLFFYLKEKLHLSPSTIMYLSTITGIAWLIKPIQGFLCDNYLSKKTWIILSLLGSILISFYLGLIAFLPLTILIALMALGSFNATIRDVANDGIMCVEGKEAGECGSIFSEPDAGSRVRSRSSKAPGAL